MLDFFFKALLFGELDDFLELSLVNISKRSRLSSKHSASAIAEIILYNGKVIVQQTKQLEMIRGLKMVRYPVVIE